MSLQLALRQLGRSLRVEVAGGSKPRRALQETWEMLKLMVRQFDRLNRFIDDMLNAPPEEAGTLDLAVEHCDLVAIAGEAVAQQRLTMPTRRVVYEPTAGLTAPVLADPRRIGQVVTNYLTNALKYAPSDRPVAVWLEVGDIEARVCVRDEGPGLPAAKKARIWERFQQIEGITRHNGEEDGRGLGLYISRTIVEPYQGEVGLESTPGQGATFWCTFPLVSANTGGGLGND